MRTSQNLNRTISQEKESYYSQDTLENPIVQQPQGNHQSHGGSSGPFKNPKTRWFFASLLSFIMAITYLCYDLSPLKYYLTKDPNFPLTNFQFNVLYSIIGMVNCLFCFVNATFIDVYGDTIGLMLGTTLISIGQLSLSVGYSNTEFAPMVIGRVLVGIGFDLVIEGANSLCNCWFKSFEVSFAHGWFTCCCLSGMMTGQILLPYLYNTYPKHFFWIILALSLVSILCAISIFALDLRLVTRNYDTIPLIKMEPTLKHAVTEHFRNVTHVDRIFIIYILSGSSYIATYNIWLANDNEMLASIWGIDPRTAGYLISFSILANIISAPISGCVIDRLHKYTSFNILVCFSIVLLGFSLITVFHSLNYLSSLIPLFLIGIGNGLFKPSFYSTSLYVTKKMRVHKGYVGFLTSFQYIVFSVGNLIFGFIREKINESGIALLVAESYLESLIVISILLLIVSWASGNENRPEPHEISPVGDISIYDDKNFMDINPNVDDKNVENSEVLKRYRVFSVHAVNRRSKSNFRRISFF